MALDPRTDALENTLVTDREHWLDGPAPALEGAARQLPGAPDFEDHGVPGRAGFWSVTKADHVHEVSRDWQTYSSELGGVTALTDAIFPVTRSHSSRPLRESSTRTTMARISSSCSAIRFGVQPH